jgi:iron complex transport system ATP-binding protein
MLDKYRALHIDRLIDATSDLYNQLDSICMKCHNVDSSINCMFCYCPLYDNENCGGNPVILSNGVKDCSNCIKPHTKEFVKDFLMKTYKEE